MTDSGPAPKVGDVLLLDGVRDQPHPFVNPILAIVVDREDPRCFLAAVLEGV